ncbi:hypothetical protein P8C59_008158 [Phyllachora maydis]|uniref:non-specific serine/threonine protein kinase n=1 Tax=Phyllachora maydis TaxID=1825666 RepID=A0AAD9IAK9_9PEZI|nr:hypothetical protein P8C59_008158 [Phyllachora maydis]
MSSRPAAASPVPVPVAMPSDYPPPAAERRRHHMAAAVPPRGSSAQQAAGASSTPRRSHASERAPNSPRRPAADAQNNPVGGAGFDEALGQSSRISQPEVDLERKQERQAQAHQQYNVDDEAAPPAIVASAEHAQRGSRSRHDHSKREKHTKFGEYILGNTIGEGEFGKVKLGWKSDSDVQVAIKLIKKDQLGSNPTRMAKIMREVSILKQLTHPNIVRLYKMEESERHYGIVLEYASGGELFDYILNHRYLKDNAARRLFAQLVSGVGYLHKKGIVHRDLKLENLLLDRNRNIIITDFGFANTFEPSDELTEEEELGLGDKDFVKVKGLDKIMTNGHRKGDLMQTSCGSPCYAAPELVVSDALYTGRKVDVWSCGVILYAMLAGYLPFDDDPANPEGDNINLLYKYIVNTPLTFPEYVTPHARDLLRRILVSNPRKRADLFEVARHSWLSEYAHVVEFITSGTSTAGEIQNVTVSLEDGMDIPTVARSASVREAPKKSAASPSIGGLASKHGTVDPDAADGAQQKAQRDNKRRTVQVDQGPVEVTEGGTASASPKDKPLPRDPPVSRDSYNKNTAGSRRPPSTHLNNHMIEAPGWELDAVVWLQASPSQSILNPTATADH